MKKKLLVFLAVLYCVQSYAQNEEYQIDLIGQGVRGLSSATLVVPNWENATKVDLRAISKGMYGVPPEGGVLFDNVDPNKYPWTQITGDYYLSGTPDASVGYYHGLIEPMTGPDLNATIGIPDYIHSFYAYVYSSDLTATFKSFVNLDHVFMFHNGSDNAYNYLVKIDKATANRNISLKIPVSELDKEIRMMVIDVKAGPVRQRFVENTYNMGNSLLLKEYLLPNVPGYVDMIEVSIFSPTINDPNYSGNGDSFFIGGVLANVDKVFDGCTHTQGYWKNHSDCKDNGNGNGNGPKRDDTWDKLPEGEETIFFLSGQNYCEVFDTNPGKGGKYYILAHQYMAAELNLLDNADPKDIAAVFTEATAFLETYTPAQVEGNSALEAKCVQMGGILDDFNNGRIGPGHCDDVEQATIDPIKQKLEKNSITIYPNPASGSGKISFKAGKPGPTLVEVYNVSGQRLGTLFDGDAKKSDQIEIEFNVLQLKEGIYFILIKNGTDVYREKLSVVR